MDPEQDLPLRNFKVLQWNSNEEYILSDPVTPEASQSSRYDSFMEVKPQLEELAVDPLGDDKSSLKKFVMFVKKEESDVHFGKESGTIKEESEWEDIGIKEELMRFANQEENCEKVKDQTVNLHLIQESDDLHQKTTSLCLQPSSPMGARQTGPTLSTIDLSRDYKQVITETSSNPSKTNIITNSKTRELKNDYIYIKKSQNNNYQSNDLFSRHLQSLCSQNNAVIPKTNMANKYINNLNTSVVVSSNTDLLRNFLQSAPSSDQYEKNKETEKNMVEPEVIQIEDDSEDEASTANNCDNPRNAFSSIFNKKNRKNINNSSEIFNTTDLTKPKVIEMSVYPEDADSDTNQVSCVSILPRINTHVPEMSHQNVPVEVNCRTTNHLPKKDKMRKKSLKKYFFLSYQIASNIRRKHMEVRNRESKQLIGRSNTNKSLSNYLFSNKDKYSEVKQTVSSKNPAVLPSSSLAESKDTVVDSSSDFKELRKTNTIHSENTNSISSFSTSSDINMATKNHNSTCECMDCKRRRISRGSKNKCICQKCEKGFDREAALRRHMSQVHSEEKLFICYCCCKGYNSQVALEYHMLHCHNPSAIKFKCLKCSKYFTHKNSLKRHTKQAHLNPEINVPEACDICQKVFTCRKSMRAHRLRKHNIHGKKYICNDCSAVFSERNRLIMHIKTYHMPPELKCSMCNDYFPTKVKLKAHLRQVHGKDNRKNYICETCGKTAKTTLGLQNHMITHTDVKPFVCEDCGKCFRTVTNLQQHSRIHSDLRSFSCDLCDKSFRIRHHLQQHMAVHGMASTPNYSKRARGNKTSNKNEDSESSSDESSET